jgi:hypothetical protein
MKNLIVNLFICVLVITSCNDTSKNDRSAEIIQKLEELKKENQRLKEEVAEINRNNSAKENIQNEQTINTVKDDYAKINKNNETIVYVDKIYEDMGTKNESQTKTKLHVSRPFSKFHFVHAAPEIFLANAYILEESIVETSSGRLFIPISAIRNDDPKGCSCTVRKIEWQTFYEIRCILPNDKTFRKAKREEYDDLLQSGGKYAVSDHKEGNYSVFTWYPK